MCDPTPRRPNVVSGQTIGQRIGLTQQDEPIGALFRDQPWLPNLYWPQVTSRHAASPVPVMQMAGTPIGRMHVLA